MQSVNFNSASKIQTSLPAIKYSKADSASLSGDLRQDSVSFTGKKEKDENDSSFVKQALNTIVAAFGAAITFLIGKIAAKPETTADAKADTPVNTDINGDSKIETTPKAEVAPKTEAVEVKEQTGVVADETVEATDEAQKEILKLVGGVEKEIQDFGATIQEQAKEIHADALGRVDKLVEIAKNYGKDADGKTVGKMKYNVDKDIYGLVLEKDGDELPDTITLEIGTDKVLSAFLRFDDGLRVDINPDVTTCNKNGIFYFDRKKDDELKAYMSNEPNSRIHKTVDFRNGKVAEYSEMEMGSIPVTHPRHAVFWNGEMVRYCEDVQFKDGTEKFTKGYAKTFGGTWDDLVQEK